MSTEWFPPVSIPALRGGPTLRWGILAPGTIAGDFTATVLTNTDQKIVAVGSRSTERARQFASRYGIPIAHAYGDHDQLLSDPTVDIIYVASPPGLHCALAMAAIAAGKHVLIEKPIAASAAEAEQIAAAAARAGVFAGEAMWTRYLPQFDVLAQIMSRGDLGAIRLATADVGWQVRADTAPGWFFQREQGGGVSLDMGVYGYWFAQFAIGRPERVSVVGNLTSSGVDEQTVASLAGADNRHASVTTTMAVTNSGLATIHGTQGQVRFLEPFVFPARLVLQTTAGAHEWSDTSGVTSRAGLAWQTTAIAGYISNGYRDSPVHPLADAIEVMRTIDTVRAELHMSTH